MRIGIRLREAETTILNIMTLEVDRRLAHDCSCPWQKKERLLGKMVLLDVKLTQDEIATMIGACRQTVTTTLQKFKDQNLIYSM